MACFSLHRISRQGPYLPGTLVPKATNEIAVTESSRPMVQPNELARSPINAVRTPIQMIDTQKHAQPPTISKINAVSQLHSDSVKRPSSQFEIPI